ncbi:phage tail termination protein [Streptomyces sp. NPDC055025]
MADVGSVDVEIALVAWFKSTLSVRTLTDLPAALVEKLPVLQIQRVGGDDDGLRLDRALIDLNGYAATRLAASELMALARGALLTQLPGTVTETAVFGRVRTVSAPSWRPYENPNLRRLGATYELFFHPVS